MPKKTTLLLFFLFKSPGGHALSRQKPRVSFGLPYLLIELFYIGIPVVRTLVRARYDILGKFIFQVGRDRQLSNDPGKVDSSFFCYAATLLSPHRNVLIFAQRMHKPT